MAFDAAALQAHVFKPSFQTYTERDVILYALGVGLGRRPTDPDHLRFTYEVGLSALPTMGVVLAHPGFWAGNPALGIDWTKMLHGEQGLTLHRPIPLAGRVCGVSRIANVVDKGEGRGALVYYVRDIFDDDTGDLIATSRQTLLCRGDGGCGQPGAPPPPHSIPDRAPDVIVEEATLPQMALLYRLSGDMNPLHADPEVARRGGFDAPILHGLATFGVAARAVLERACGFDPARFESFDVRFTSPVFPGETLRTALWIDGVEVSVRAWSVERDKMVLDNGLARVRP